MRWHTHACPCADDLVHSSHPDLRGRSSHARLELGGQLRLLRMSIMHGIANKLDTNLLICLCNPWCLCAQQLKNLPPVHDPGGPTQSDATAPHVQYIIMDILFVSVAESHEVPANATIPTAFMRHSWCFTPGPYQNRQTQHTIRWTNLDFG